VRFFPPPPSPDRPAGRNVRDDCRVRSVVTHDEYVIGQSSSLLGTVPGSSLLGMVPPTRSRHCHGTWSVSIGDLLRATRVPPGSAPHCLAVPTSQPVCPVPHPPRYSLGIGRGGGPTDPSSHRQCQDHHRQTPADRGGVNRGVPGGGAGSPPWANHPAQRVLADTSEEAGPVPTAFTAATV
jgi:hypothetical protein